MKNDSIPPPLSFACPQRWDAMQTAGPGRRFCEQCQLHVHDLSALSKREGERLLAPTSGPICISYQTRADGSMVVRTGWLRVVRAVTALAAVVMPLLFASCADRSYQGRTGGVICDPKDAANTNPPPPDLSRTIGTPLAAPAPTEYHDAH